MRSNLWSAASRLIAGRRLRKKIYTTGTALGLIVVVSVFYLLAHPAVTMERELLCLHTEHTHTDTCYGDVLVCEESAASAELQEDTDATGSVLVCEAEQIDAHSHTGECSLLQIVNVCGIAESAGHSHNADCYSEDVQTCVEPECDAHAHTEGCFAEESTFVCEQTETSGHTHDEACYADLSADDDISGGGDNNNSSDDTGDEHVHTAECYTRGLVCGLEEHLHIELCNAPETEVTFMPMSLDVNGYSSELTDFLRGFVIKDAGGNPIGPDSTIYVGDTYQITLSFSENYPSPFEQFEYDGSGKLTYQLPAILKVAQAETNGEIKFGATDRVIGRYTINTDGLLEVWFEKGLDADGTPLAGNPDKDYIEYNNVSFSIVLSALVESANVGEDKEIIFGDNAKITVDVKGKSGDIDVTKTLTGGDYRYHTFTYKVVVKAVGGTIENVTLEDTVFFDSKYGTSLDSNDFSLANVPATISIVKDNPEGYTKGPFPVTFTEVGADGKFMITLGDGTTPFTLLDGEYVELSYTLKVDDSNFMTEGEFGLFKPNGESHRASDMFNGNIINKVTVNGTANDGVEDIPVDDTSEVSTPVSLDLVDKKDGVRTVVDDRNLVKWTARIGDGYFDIGGQSVVDMLSDSMEFVTDIPIKVQPRIMTASGTLVNFGQPFFVDWNAANPVNPWDTVTTGNNSTLKRRTFKWSVPPNSWKNPDGGFQLCYELEYYSTEPVGAPGAFFMNDIILGEEFRDGPYDIGGISVPGLANPIQELKKVGKYAIDPNTGKLCLEYKVTVKIAKEAYGKQLYLYDSMRMDGTSSSGTALYGNRISQKIYDVTFKLQKLDGADIDESVYKPAVYGNLYDYFFFFNHTESEAALITETNLNSARTKSTWNVNDDSELTITYRVSIEDAIIENDGRTLRELIDAEDLTYAKNDINLIQNGKDNKTSSYIYPMITKSVVPCYWSIINVANKTYDWVNKNQTGFSETAYEDAKVNGKVGFYYSVVINPRAWSFGDGTDAGTPIAPIFSDSFDDRLVYAPRSMKIMRIERKEGSGSAGTNMELYTSGGVLDTNTNWGLQQRADGWNMPIANTTCYVNSIDGTGKLSLDFKRIDRRVNDNNSVTRGTKELATPDWYALPDSIYRVNYVLYFPGDPPAGMKVYDNTATITLSNSSGDEVSFSADASIEYGTPMLEKKMELAGKTAEVTIDINPGGIILTEDGVQDGVMEIDDIMTNLTLYSTSLKIKVNYDGVWVDKEPIFNATGQLFGYTSQSTDDGGEKLTIWLPGGRPIQITYSALIKGEVGQTVDVENSVSIYGTDYRHSVGDDSFSITTTTGSGGASSGALIIIKYDSTSPDTYLPGAVFDIYTNVQQIAADISKTIVTDSTTYYYYKTVTIGPSGSLTIKDDAMLPDTVWAIIETGTPAGYIPSDDPIFFYLAGGSKLNIPTEAKEISDTLMVPNDPYHTALPATGGGGSVKYTAVGLALIAVSVTAALQRGRRRGGHPVP